MQEGKELFSGREVLTSHLRWCYAWGLRLKARFVQGLLIPSLLDVSFVFITYLLCDLGQINLYEPQFSLM